MPKTYYAIVYNYPRWTGLAKIETQTGIYDKIFKTEEEARVYHKENMPFCEIVEIKPLTVYEGEIE